MKLRDLEYLVAVADHNHFGKAAEKCHVSQPALSQQLQKLEHYLGVQLIERSNKSFLLTAIGNDIVKRARSLLNDAKAIKDLAIQSKDPFSGTLKLGAFPTLSPYLFPQLIPGIRKVMPNLKLFLVEEKSEQLLKKLKQGEIDAALLSLPIEDDNLECLTLFDEAFFLAVPLNHALATRKSIKTADLVNEQLCLLEDGHCLRKQALDICNAMGISEFQDFSATSLETLRQMVAANVCITLMPKLAINKQSNIRYIPFSSPKVSRSIALVWRKTSSRSVCFEKLAEICIQLGAPT